MGAAIAVPLAAVAVYFAFVDHPAPDAPPPAVGVAQPGLPADHPPVDGQTAVAPPEQHPQMGGSGRPVRVPESVRGKWRAVTLTVEAKDGAGPPQRLTIALGGRQSLPGGAIEIEAREFLPALQVQNAEITSASNDPTNPAALVRIREKGREIFMGWLFASFPEMQPFEHPTTRITLLEGVPAR